MMMEFKVDFKGGSDEIKGIGYGLLSMSAYTAFILINRTINDQVHVHTRAFYQMLAGTCVVLPLAAGDLDTISVINWIWLSCVGLFPGFLAILCAVIALSRLPAAVFGTLSYVEPVAVILFGWLLFSESLGPLQTGGCLLIIISGIFQALAGSTKKKGI
jgi:drug/metabolite transporter (DMT)-like permease